MREKFIKLIAAALIIGGFSYYYVYDHTINFMYVNPYTETSGMQKIAKTIRELNKTLNKTKYYAALAGQKFDYILINGYGSGFLQRNPIPNDLDTEIFIDLGTFDYDKIKDKSVIADQIVKKMDAFQYYLVKSIENSQPRIFYGIKSPHGIKSYMDSRHEYYTLEIANSLDKAISNKKYINHLTKVSKHDGETNYYMPYVMEPGHMIVKDYDIINLYSDIVSYNDEMLKYMRIVSLSLSFSAKIKHNGKIHEIEMIPELRSTGPLTIEYRLYAPNVFYKDNSKNYIKNWYAFKDEEQYVKWLLYCYADILKVIYPDDAFEYNPIKIFKRTLQLTDMISPVLGKNEAEEIYNYIYKNLQNRDIQLLNEYINITDILGHTFKAGKMYSNFKSDNKIVPMVKKLNEVVQELKRRGNIKPEDMKVLEDFVSIDINKQLKSVLHVEVTNRQKEELDPKFKKVITPLISKIVLYTVTDANKMQSVIRRLKNIYFDAGYHYVHLYVANTNTFYVEKDEFTSSIKDFKDFALKNNLAEDMNFIVLPKEQIPQNLMKYLVWVRYNPTASQEAYYNKIKQILLDNRDEFKLNQKRFFVK